MSEPEEPRTYGKCRIEREIARGAASTVYLAWHEALQISVALKVMRKDEAQQAPSLSQRVMREAHIAAQLTHPNIIRIYDCGETEDAYYLVLEYIEGKNCHEKLDEDGAFEWREAASIIQQAAEGLRHAHQRGVIHRDLKPQNIMIDGDGNARIADMGLAKVAAPGKPSETLGGDVLGTAYYMSPEQVRQPGEVDFRSDIYSLGATLYRMAVGEPPTLTAHTSRCSGRAQRTKASSIPTKASAFPSPSRSKALTAVATGPPLIPRTCFPAESSNLGQ